MGTPHAPGTFCWAELLTTDATTAKEFYSQLFGWELHDDPLPQGGVYTMAKVDDGNVGAMYEMGPEQRAQGIPPHWLPYMSVASVADAADKARELGGSVVMGPMDIFDVGSMAVLQDPVGCTFAVWQAKQHTGMDHVDARPGTFCWAETMTTDTDRVGSFYSQLFGWDAAVKDMGEVAYHIFLQGDTQKGGMMEIQPDMGPVPPHWMLYVAVEDCDASTAKAEELGAKVIVPPTDIPDIGRFSLFQDPTGAMLSVIAMPSA